MIADISSAHLLNQSTGSENAAKGLKSGEAESDKELRGTFDKFVGETFFGQMLNAMRSMTDKPAYFHGGRAEEVFQGQLDQMLSEKLTESSAESFSGPMFELFNLQRGA